MTKQHTTATDSADRPALQIEITPAMIEAVKVALVAWFDRGDDFEEGARLLTSSPNFYYPI